jgi:hypothetical protein
VSADKKLVCQLIVTLAVVLPFWGFVFCLFFYAREIDSSARDTVTQITGGLIAAFAGSIGFWLGTSASSAAKDATISTLTGATK